MTDKQNSPVVRKQPSKLPLFNVVLINDDDHTHEYVVEMLQSIFAYPVEMGFQMADEVDRSGRVIVFTAHKEHAELKKEFIDAFGVDPRVEECHGSMTAVLEPADGE
jgi:ATP-dependent Clp protease adaptor protein ClpS